MLVSACASANSFAFEPTPIPTPDPCNQDDVVKFHGKWSSVYDEFADAFELAMFVNHNELPRYIDKMQSIRRDTRAIKTPSCARKVKETTIIYMNNAIDAMLFDAISDSPEETLEKQLFAIDSIEVILEEIGELSIPGWE